MQSFQTIFTSTLFVGFCRTVVKEGSGDRIRRGKERFLKSLFGLFLILLCFLQFVDAGLSREGVGEGRCTAVRRSVGSEKSVGIGRGGEGG
jgi:hypothetical protein